MSAIFVWALVNSTFFLTGLIALVKCTETFFNVCCYIGPFALFFLPFNFKTESRKDVQSSDIQPVTESQLSCFTGARSSRGEG